MLSNVLFVGLHTVETCAPIKHWALISVGEPDSYDGSPKITPGWWIADEFGLPFNRAYQLQNKHVYKLLRKASQEGDEYAG
jgi:hypothetical protein